jgi:arylsulfatase A-like enzyme
VRFIEEKAAAETPWFLFSSYIHPHPPFAPPKPWHRLYRTNEMPLPFVPDGSEELHTWINRVQNRYKWRDRGIDQNLVRTIKAYCYATISFVDYQVGRILAALEETGQLDNTLIIFASDHGEDLLRYLQSVNAADAYVETDTGLEWKKYDPIDGAYLQDPDAGLLFQDYPSYELEVSEYLDGTEAA